MANATRSAPGHQPDEELRLQLSPPMAAALDEALADDGSPWRGRQELAAAILRGWLVEHGHLQTDDGLSVEELTAENDG
ncbi:hypothetical protein [Terrarubrum flagellatum]|uniref:hypothetical protein n=1 Tax=Terrirubrum flagellatum TaxID=2895980 RepID=UPI00314514ED